MKKFAKNYTVYQILLGVWCAFVVSFCFFNAGEEKSREQIIFSICAGLAFLLFYTVYALLYRKCSGYEITETEVIVKRGVFFRKESRVLRSRIHAVNKRMNIVQRILGICTLQADSGSANTPNEEIVIFETIETAEKLYLALSQKTTLSEENDAPQTFYDFTTGRKVLYGLTESSFMLVFPIFLGGIISFLSYFLPEEGEVLTLNDLILLGVIIALSLYVISLVIAIPVSILRFHDFEVKRVGKKIEVNYGLLTKVHNSFALNRIRAIEVSDNILQRLFGFVSVKVHVIGYLEGNNGKNNGGMQIGMLLPLIKKTEVKGMIESLLPDYLPEEQTTKAKNYFPFISWQLVFFFAINAILFSVLSIVSYYIHDILPLTIGGSLLGVIDVLIVFFTAWDTIVQYHFAGFALNEEKVTLKTGGLTRKTFVIQKRNLTSIETITTPLRQKHSIMSYQFHFRSNFFLNTVLVPMQDAKLKPTIEAYLPK